MAADIRSGVIGGKKKDRALGRVFVQTQEKERVPLLQADNEEWFAELQPGMHIAFSMIREGEPRARCQRVLSVPAAPCWPALHCGR
jgi:hypothetical protein